MNEPFEGDVIIANPYAVVPAQGVSMQDAQRHDSGNALAANAEVRVVAEVKAQVLMARQFPRDEQMAAEKILRECARPTLADAAVYTFPRGKETVTGPSIRLAEVLARNWGNCTFGYEVLERRQDNRGVGYSVIRAYAWDLETNMYISRQFELKHWRTTKNGGYKLTDDRDIYELEANMASRRIRACILQMVPGDVTQIAVAACRKTASSGLAEKMADKEQREKLISATVRIYERMGISLADLEDYLNAKKQDWSADHMLRLKELKNSIDDGVLPIGEVFPHLAGNDKNATVSKEQAVALMEAAKATGRQGEISDALKKAGIAKFADTPAARYEEVKSLIASFGTQEQPAKIEGGSDKPVPSEGKEK